MYQGKKTRILNNKYFKLAIILITFIAIVTMIISLIVKGHKNGKCNNLRNDILNSVDEYVKANNLLPELNGDTVVIKLTEYDKKFAFKDKQISGKVIYTKYNNDYIKTVELENADYCTTNWNNKETKKYNEKKNMKVTAYFNYYEVSSYNSKWTNYIPSEKISTEETDGVLLPINSKLLPTIPNDAVVTEYIRDTKTYYSFRDKKWKWYKNDIKYSDYSSTQPNGYTNKDKATLKNTELSEWSLDYPEEFEYRHISSKTGYQWYKKEGKEKVYWENGKYAVESPGEGYEMDKEKKAKMYAYYDETWRWYNGDTKRIYSSLSSAKPKGYNYKDETTLTYTSWTSFKDYSSLNSENKNYREEKKDTYSRYLIKYDIYSYAMLDNPVTLEELEKKIGKSYKDIVNDKSYKVEVTFKFQNEAR